MPEGVCRLTAMRMWVRLVGTRFGLPTFRGVAALETCPDMELVA